MAHEIELVPLAALATAFHPANPKSHDLPEIKASIARHGFTEPPLLDDRTGMIAAGHGRVEALLELEAEGADVPKGIYLGTGEGWLVPVLRGALTTPDDTAAKAYLVTSNRLTEKGGWIAQGLADVLTELAAVDDGLVGTGYDEADLDELLASLAPPTEPEEREPKAVTRFSVVVDVADTETQNALMDRLDREGFRCRALNS
jgi:ParB-like chromosome segregation protein Spo0J